MGHEKRELKKKIKRAAWRCQRMADWKGKSEEKNDVQLVHTQ